MMSFREFVNESKDPTAIIKILKYAAGLSSYEAEKMAKQILTSKNPKAIIMDNIDKTPEKIWSMIQDEM